MARLEARICMRSGTAPKTVAAHGQGLIYLLLGRRASRELLENYSCHTTLQGLKQALEKNGLSDLVTLTCGRRGSLYMEQTGRDNDLDLVLTRYEQQLLHGFERKQWDVRFSVRGKAHGFRLLAEVILRRRHSPSRWPIEVRLNAVPEVAGQGRERQFRLLVERLEQDLRSLLLPEHLESTVSTGDRQEKTTPVHNQEANATVRPPAPGLEPTSSADQENVAGSLFPLFGIVLGKTGKQELARRGSHARGRGDDGKRYKYYVINGFNFWYDHGVAEHMYLTYSDPLPDQWRALGFDWPLSYREWNKLLQGIGCTVSIITKPHTARHYSGKYDSFEAALRATHQTDLYSVIMDFSFCYSEGTKPTDKNTLYSLTVRAS